MLGAAATLGVARAPTALVPDAAVGSTSRAHLYAGHPDHGDPPSIALVVADDLGYADAGFTGAGGVAATPHLDALASAGVRLDRHYVQPICSPTRAALLTGRHVLRYGLQNAVIWPSAAWSLPKNETLMAEHLRAAGYRTAILGKWHLGMHASWALPRARGFDEQLGMYTGTVDYFRHTTRDGAVDWHYNDSRVETRDNGTYSSVVLGAAAADFVERNARRKWFLYLAMQSVHHPLHAPEECLARYPQLSGEVKARAAMVSALDDAVGELTAALERSGQAERTLVLFLSDNGAPYIDAVFDHDEGAVVAARLGARRRRLEVDLEGRAAAAARRGLAAARRHRAGRHGARRRRRLELPVFGVEALGLRGRRALRRVRVVGAAQPRARRLVARRPLPRGRLDADARQAGGRLDGDEPAARRLRRPAGADEGRRRLARETRCPSTSRRADPTRTARGASSTGRRRRSSSASSSSSSTASGGASATSRTRSSSTSPPTPPRRTTSRGEDKTT